MCHVGRVLCVAFDRFAQVRDSIARHVQQDLIIVRDYIDHHDDEVSQTIPRYW